MKLNKEAIHEKMKEKGVSFRKFSKMTGIPTASLSDYAQGRKNVPRRRLEIIADCLDVDILEIAELNSTW